MDALSQSIRSEPVEPVQARVYLDFYRLIQAPFTITPDPEFLFTGSSHQQAIEKITYAIDSRMGFILLTGEVGTGKTTVCRTLLDRLNDSAETVYIINPSISGRELLAGILEDAGIRVDADSPRKGLIDRLYQHLLSRDRQRPFVVIIDDAQTMPPETLEDLRLLSNLETDKSKLIQVVLSGQPELIDQLDSTGLRQLRQRIAIHCPLRALSAAETGAYITQRLVVAGNQGQVRFSDNAARLVHRAAGGIPRLINKICDYAMTAGYVKDTPVIGRQHIRMALDELKGAALNPPARSGRRFGMGHAVMAVLLVAILSASILNSVRRMPDDRPSTVDASIGLSDPPGNLSPAIPLPAAEVTAAPARSMDPPAHREPTAVTNTGGLKYASPAPYALQLGSFSSRERAERSVEQYRRKSIPAHWQPVNNGQWFRVIAGKFNDLDRAGDYRRVHGLEGSVIINAPLTVEVLPDHPGVSGADIPDFLSRIGHGCLMESGPAGDNEFYTGLFASVEDASRIADTVNASRRFLAQVVER